MTNRLTRICFLIIAVTVVLSPFRPAPAHAAGAVSLSGLESFADAFMEERMHDRNIPNAVVAIVAAGELRFAKGYGLADREAQTPVSVDHTLFRLGSTSKLVTWTAVMQLAEQGKLDLDADINDYLDFAIPARLHDGTAAAPITMKHLLTHTAGFEDSVNNLFRLSPEAMPPLGDYVKQYLPARVFPAGSVAAYSNYGTTLAGYIVERVSGQPFADYVQQHIFAPLGMNQSNFAQPLPAPLAADLARPYRFVGDTFREGSFEYMPAPAGGMSSSARDMATFMLAHLHDGTYNGGRILSPETVRLMHAQLYTQHRALSGVAHGFMEGTMNGYRVLFHDGNTTLYDTGLYLVPELGVGLFASYSGDSFVTHTELFQAFMNEYFPASVNATDSAPAALDPPAGAAARARTFTGEYQQNRRNVTTSEALLSLMTGIINVSADPDGYLLVTHIGETYRFVEIEPGLYRNTRPGLDYFGPFQTIAFGTDPLGRTMLMTDGPMTYSRAPAYATSTFTLSVLLLSVAFIAVTLVVWLVRGIIRLILRPVQARQAKLATLVAGGFGLLTVIVVIGVLAGSQPDPVHILPKAALEPPSAADALTDALLWFMVPLGLATAAFAILHWRRPVWGVLARIHYSLFSLAALTLLAVFTYWNVLF